MSIFPACCIADCVAEMSVVVMLLTWHGIGTLKSMNSFLGLHAPWRLSHASSHAQTIKYVSTVNSCCHFVLCTSQYMSHCPKFDDLRPSLHYFSHCICCDPSERRDLSRSSAKSQASWTKNPEEQTHCGQYFWVTKKWWHPIKCTQVPRG